jgi:RNA polymerase sigma-B factor
MAPADIDLRTAALFQCIAGTDDAEERRRLRHEIVALNLPTARRVAARYAGRGEALEDLVQVACVALVKTVRTFDADRHNSFTAYAVPSMHGEVKRHFRDHGWGIRPPRHIQDARSGVTAAVAALTQSLGRRPAVDDIVAITGLDAETVEACLASNDLYRLASIEALSPSDGGRGDTRPAGPADVLGDVDSRLELVEDRVTLERLIAALGPRERRLIRLRFVHEWTQSQIADDLGISQVQVSRLLAKVLSGLRASLAAA